MASDFQFDVAAEVELDESGRPVSLGSNPNKLIETHSLATKTATGIIQKRSKKLAEHKSAMLGNLTFREIAMKRKKMLKTLERKVFEHKVKRVEGLNLNSRLSLLFEDMFKKEITKGDGSSEERKTIDPHMLIGKTITLLTNTPQNISIKFVDKTPVDLLQKKMECITLKSIKLKPGIVVKESKPENTMVSLESGENNTNGKSTHSPSKKATSLNNCLKEKDSHIKPSEMDKEPNYDMQNETDKLLAILEGSPSQNTTEVLKPTQKSPKIGPQNLQPRCLSFVSDTEVKSSASDVLHITEEDDYLFSNKLSILSEVASGQLAIANPDHEDKKCDIFKGIVPISQPNRVQEQTSLDERTGSGVVSPTKSIYLSRETAANHLSISVSTASPKTVKHKTKKDLHEFAWCTQYISSSYKKPAGIPITRATTIKTNSISSKSNTSEMKITNQDKNVNHDINVSPNRVKKFSKLTPPIDQDKYESKILNSVSFDKVSKQKNNPVKRNTISLGPQFQESVKENYSFQDEMDKDISTVKVNHDINVSLSSVRKDFKSTPPIDQDKYKSKILNNVSFDKLSKQKNSLVKRNTSSFVSPFQESVKEKHSSQDEIDDDISIVKEVYVTSSTNFEQSVKKDKKCLVQKSAGHTEMAKTNVPLLNSPSIDKSSLRKQNSQGKSTNKLEEGIKTYSSKITKPYSKTCKSNKKILLSLEPTPLNDSFSTKKSIKILRASEENIAVRKTRSSNSCEKPKVLSTGPSINTNLTSQKNSSKVAEQQKSKNERNRKSENPGEPELNLQNVRLKGKTFCASEPHKFCETVDAFKENAEHSCLASVHEEKKNIKYDTNVSKENIHALHLVNKKCCVLLERINPSKELTEENNSCARLGQKDHLWSRTCENHGKKSDSSQGKQVVTDDVRKTLSSDISIESDSKLKRNILLNRNLVEKGHVQAFQKTCANLVKNESVQNKASRESLYDVIKSKRRGLPSKNALYLHNLKLHLKKSRIMKSKLFSDYKNNHNVLKIFHECPVGVNKDNAEVVTENKDRFQPQQIKCQSLQENTEVVTYDQDCKKTRVEEPKSQVNNSLSTIEQVKCSKITSPSRKKLGQNNSEIKQQLGEVKKTDGTTHEKSSPFVQKISKMKNKANKPNKGNPKNHLVIKRPRGRPRKRVKQLDNYSLKMQDLHSVQNREFKKKQFEQQFEQIKSIIPKCLPKQKSTVKSKSAATLKQKAVQQIKSNAISILSKKRLNQNNPGPSRESVEVKNGEKGTHRKSGLFVQDISIPNNNTDIAYSGYSETHVVLKRSRGRPRKNVIQVDDYSLKMEELHSVQNKDLMVNESRQFEKTKPTVNKNVRKRKSVSPKSESAIDKVTNIDLQSQLKPVKITLPSKLLGNKNERLPELLKNLPKTIGNINNKVPINNTESNHLNTEGECGATTNNFIIEVVQTSNVREKSSCDLNLENSLLKKRSRGRRPKKKGFKNSKIFNKPHMLDPKERKNYQNKLSNNDLSSLSFVTNVQTLQNASQNTVKKPLKTNVDNKVTITERVNDKCADSVEKLTYSGYLGQTVLSNEMKGTSDHHKNTSARSKNVKQDLSHSPCYQMSATQNILKRPVTKSQQSCMNKLPAQPQIEISHQLQTEVSNQPQTEVSNQPQTEVTNQRQELIKSKKLKVRFAKNLCTRINSNRVTRSSSRQFNFTKKDSENGKRKKNSSISGPKSSKSLELINVPNISKSQILQTKSVEQTRCSRNKFKSKQQKLQSASCKNVTRKKFINKSLILNEESKSVEDNTITDLNKFPSEKEIPPIVTVFTKHKLLKQPARKRLLKSNLMNVDKVNRKARSENEDDENIKEIVFFNPLYNKSKDNIDSSNISSHVTPVNLVQLPAVFQVPNTHFEPLPWSQPQANFNMLQPFSPNNSLNMSNQIFMCQQSQEQTQIHTVYPIYQPLESPHLWVNHDSQVYSLNHPNSQESLPSEPEQSVEEPCEYGQLVGVSGEHDKTIEELWKNDDTVSLSRENERSSGEQWQHGQPNALTRENGQSVGETSGCDESFETSGDHDASTTESIKAVGNTGIIKISSNSVHKRKKRQPFFKKRKRKMPISVDNSANLCSDNSFPPHDQIEPVKQKNTPSKNVTESSCECSKTSHSLVSKELTSCPTSHQQFQESNYSPSGSTTKTNMEEQILASTRKRPKLRKMNLNKQVKKNCQVNYSEKSTSQLENVSERRNSVGESATEKTGDNNPPSPDKKLLKIMHYLKRVQRSPEITIKKTSCHELDLLGLSDGNETEDPMFPLSVVIDAL